MIIDIYTTTKITPTALDALRKAEIKATNQGFSLDTFQMENRKDYNSFKAVIQAIKGRWNGKTHLFPYNPTDAIQQILESGFVPIHNPYSLFETPEAGVDDLFIYLGIDNPYMDGKTWRILEPSAGTGRIAHLIRERFPLAEIDVCEIDPFNRAGLETSGFNIVADDFLTLETDQKYDFILMNPPFKGTEYIDHILKAFSLLKTHGKLAAIVPSGFLSGSTKKIVNFRNLVAEYGDWEEFGHEFKDAKIKCYLITLENFSAERLANLWHETNGYSSWLHYNAELYLDNEREYHDGKDRISKLPVEQWQVEAKKLCDSVANKLIMAGQCFLWDQRIKDQVYANCLDDIAEHRDYDAAKVEVEPNTEYSFKPVLTGKQGDLFEPQILQGSLL